MARFVHFYPALLLLLWWLACRHRHPDGRRSRALISALALLTLLSWPPVLRVSFLVLERGYPDRVELQGAEAIVVLSGSMRQPDERHARVRLGLSTYCRVRAGAELVRGGSELPIVVSGGRVRADAEVALADAMREQLLAEGVPADRIWVEDRSSTTWENATFTKELLQERGVRRIALVTEAYHMPRSVACFEAQDLEVVPVPCEYRSRGPRLRWTSLLPSPQALVEHERLFHELVGMLYYRICGRF